MPLPTLSSYAQSSASLHLNGPSSSSPPPPPSAASISLPSLWQTLVEHGVNKRKALTALHEQNLGFLHQEIERIARAFDLSANQHLLPFSSAPISSSLTPPRCCCSSSASHCPLYCRPIPSDDCVPSTKRSRFNEDSTDASETKAERLARLQLQQQQIIQSMQQHLLQDEVPSPPPPPSPSSPSPSSSSDQENVPPPSLTSPPTKSKAAKKPRRKAADSEADASTQGEDDEAQPHKSKRAKKKVVEGEEGEEREKEGKKRGKGKKAEKAEKVEVVEEELKPRRTRAAAKKAEADTAKETMEEVKPKKGGRKKKEKPAVVEAAVEVEAELDPQPQSVAVEVKESEVMVEEAKSEEVTVVEVVEEVQAVTIDGPLTSPKLPPTTGTDPAPITASAISQPNLGRLLADMEDEVKPTPVVQQHAPAYPSLLSIIPPTIPVQSSPLPSPTSPPVPPSTGGGFLSYMNPFRSILGRFVQPAPKLEHVDIAHSITPALTPFTLSPTPSPTPSPSTSPTLRPSPTPTVEPALRGEELGVGKLKKKDLLKKHIESSQREQAAKMEEARQLGGGSHGGARSSSGSSSSSSSSTSGGVPQPANEEVKEAVVEHVQVIDLDQGGDDEGVGTPAKGVEEVKAEVTPLPRVDGSHLVVSALVDSEVVEVVHAMEVDAVSIPVAVTEAGASLMEVDVEVVDCTLDEGSSSAADDAESSSGEGRGEAQVKESKEERLKRAKALKDADVAKKREKALEAARKREEAERKRKLMTEAAREKLEEERRRKEEQSKKQKLSTLTQATLDKRKAPTIKGPPPSSSSSSASSKAKAEAGGGKKKDEKNFRTAPAALQSTTGTAPPPLPARPLHGTMPAAEVEDGVAVTVSYTEAHPLSHYQPVDSPVKADAPAPPLPAAVDPTPIPTPAPCATQPPPIPVRHQTHQLPPPAPKSAPLSPCSSCWVCSGEGVGGAGGHHEPSPSQGTCGRDDPT